MRRGSSLIQRQEKDVLTVSSLSTASKRISLEWLTSSVWKVPLLNRISRAKRRILKRLHRKSLISGRIGRGAQDHVKV